VPATVPATVIIRYGEKYTCGGLSLFDFPNARNYSHGWFFRKGCRAVLPLSVFSTFVLEFCGFLLECGSHILFPGEVFLNSRE